MIDLNEQWSTNKSDSDCKWILKLGATECQNVTVTLLLQLLGTADSLSAKWMWLVTSGVIV